MATTTTLAAAETASQAQRDRVLDLYEQGLYLQAHAATKEIAPLDEWRGTQSRILAARLGRNLGAPRKASAWILHAYRADPEAPLARYYAAYQVLQSRGPLRALEILRAPLPDGVDAIMRADWEALSAHALAMLRDFAPANAAMERALELAPEHAWLCVEHAGLLEVQDRREEALAAGRRCLELQPFFRPGVQHVAHLLEQLNRVDEAYDLLREASESIESCHVVAQLATLQAERHEWTDARQSWDRFEELAPLLDEGGQLMLKAQRAEAAYQLGDLETTVSLAGDVGPWQLTAAINVAYCPDGRRTELEVEFVKQHHKTCGPATLTMMCGFWSMPVDHLELAAEICYDGTSNLSERRWATDNGWIAREFTLDWEAAVALIDRGVPFSLITTETTSAHAQLVVGYDERRGTLLVRDPEHRRVQEFLCELALWRYAPVGPRAMALVPSAEAARLDGVELPDTALYDSLYAMERALAEHDREVAQTAFEELRAQAPDHRLTHTAGRNLGIYDGDPLRMLDATEALLRLYPDSQVYELSKLAILGRLGRRDELSRLLRDVCQRERIDPTFRRALADDLSSDASQRDEARRQVRRALRQNPLDAHAFLTLADMLYQERAFEAALPIYRYAACLEDKTERFARSYFLAAWHQHDTFAALDLLQERVQRLSELSAQPVHTLVWAYDLLGQSQEGLAAVGEAVERRADDGELLLMAASIRGRHGDVDAARELLAQAKGKVRAPDLWRAEADLAILESDLERALELRGRVHEAEPRDVSALEDYLALLLRLRGRPEARAHLERVAEEQARNVTIRQLRVQWVDSEEPTRREALVRELIADNPSNAWAHRELALCLGEQRRAPEAVEALDPAFRLAPHDPGAYGVLGRVHELSGDMAAAREAYQQALLLEIDYDPAIGGLLRTCEDAEAREAALAFLEAELTSQRVYGTAIYVLYDQARGVLDPEAVLAALRTCHAEHAELWQSWSALVGQLGDMNQLDEALELAERAAKRFPLQTQILFDVAWVQQLRGRSDEEVAALERTLQLSPGHGHATRALILSHLRQGAPEKALPLLERRLTNAPLDAEAHLDLARALWDLERKDEAFERAERALKIDPSSERGWELLGTWGVLSEQPERLEHFARGLIEERPKSVDAYLVLARALPVERADEILSLFDTAQELDPRNTDVYDQRAQLLAAQGRFDEALACCTPEEFGDSPPLPLRGRAAWIELVRGNEEEGLKGLNALVEESPSYGWAWTTLSNYCLDTGDFKGHLRAAEALVRMAPQSPSALTQLGTGRLLTQDRDGAKQAFMRALDAEPGAYMASKLMIDLFLEEDEVDAAAMILEDMRRHDDAAVWSRAVDIAVRQGNREAAEEAFRTLSTKLDDEGTGVQRGAAAISERGWTRTLDRLLAEAIKSDDERHPEVGRLWSQRLIDQGKFRDVADALPALLNRGELGARAVSAYVEGLGERNYLSDLRKLTKARSKALRAHTGMWGSVGFALHACGAHKETVAWLSDWSRREDVQAWMIHNMLLSLLELGRLDDLERPIGAAEQLPPDGSADPLNTIGAWDKACRGRREAAEAQLGMVDTERLSPFYMFFFGLAAVTALGLRPGAYGEARSRLRQVAADLEGFQHVPSLRTAYLRSAKRIADREGGLASVWYFFCWLWWAVLCRQWFA